MPLLAMQYVRNLRLIILRRNLKVGLGMGAGGADLRGFRTHHDVAAVAALPYLNLTLLENLLGLHEIGRASCRERVY